MIFYNSNSSDINANMDNVVIAAKTVADGLKNELPEFFKFNSLITQTDREIAIKLKSKYRNFVMVGMGGAILNPQMQLSLLGLNHAQNNENSNFFYIDCLDELYITELMSDIELKDTIFIFISKSGQSVEVHEIFKFIADFLLNNSLNLADHALAITSKNGELGALVYQYGVFVLEHTPNVGGRFSCFCNNTYIPAFIAGIDDKTMRESANNAIESFINHPENHLATKMALLNSLPKNIHVIMLYNKNLKYFANWYAQMLAESLGKDNKGITPVINYAPMDYHSQVQLYLSGPKDKLFSLIKIDSSSNNNLTTLLDKQFELFENELKNGKQPYQTMQIKKFDESVLGELMVNVILEIMIIAKIWDINPYTQPAIQKIKELLV